MARALKLLILDDREDYLRALHGALRKEFDVVTAQTAAEATRLLDVETKVVLIDVRLSETDATNRDGLEFLRLAKMRFPRTPMLMMSAYRDFDSAVEALNYGADYFLKKPVELDSLRELISDFANRGLLPDRTSSLRAELEQERI